MWWVGKNIYSYPPIGSPSGGAHVISGDLNQFLKVVKTGKLLSPSMTEAFSTPQAIHRQMDGWTKWNGFGLWFYVDESWKVIFYEKEGENAGVSGFIRHYPEQDISVVMLSNMETGVWEPVSKIHGLVVSGEIG